MGFHAVVLAYGGPALFVWAWLQGEAAVIVGGALAAQGYWPWWGVWLLACVPAVLGHQIYFLLGRYGGDRLIARLPVRWHPAVERARVIVRERDSRIMLLMRFAYGIRLPLPFVCGAAGISPLRFLRYNVGTALLWSLIFTALGLAWGTAATAVFGRVAHYGMLVLLGSVAFGLAAQRLTQRWSRPLT